jgi:hypothetical protein
VDEACRDVEEAAFIDFAALSAIRSELEPRPATLGSARARINVAPAVSKASSREMPGVAAPGRSASERTATTRSTRGRLRDGLCAPALQIVADGEP